MRFFQGDDNSELRIIYYKFIQSGHSYLPSDSDFASMENYSKNGQIYGPDDRRRIIIQARKKHPSHLTMMTGEDFLSSENLENCMTRRKRDTKQLPVNWFKIQ